MALKKKFIDDEHKPLMYYVIQIEGVKNPIRKSMLLGPQVLEEAEKTRDELQAKSLAKGKTMSECRYALEAA